MDYASTRTDYAKGSLRRADLASDPIAQFEKWIAEAHAANVIEPTAMTLATVGADARPRARTVLLKGLDERGFVFFTNLESRKGSAIAENTHVSLLFPWLLQERQILVAGAAARVSDAEAAAYFNSRPLLSRLAAWSSKQSAPIADRAALEADLAKTKARFADADPPLPPFWGGYRVTPETIEFWQGRRDRLHDRFEYQRIGDSWTIQRLAP